MAVLFLISHVCQISFEYIIVILFYVLTELGYVLKCYVKEKRKCSFENVFIESSSP